MPLLSAREVIVRRQLSACAGAKAGAPASAPTNADETAADLLGDVKLATSKRTCPIDGITGAAIPRGFRLEQSQHTLRTVRRPHRDNPPVSLAQRLRRTHTQILPRPALCPPMPRIGNRTPSGDLRRNP